MYKRSLQAAKKGKTLTFHWRGGYLTREVLNELLGLIRKAGEEKKRQQLSISTGRRLYCACIIQKHRCRNASQWKMQMKGKKNNDTRQSIYNKRGDIHA